MIFSHVNLLHQSKGFSVPQHINAAEYFQDAGGKIRSCTICPVIDKLPVKNRHNYTPCFVYTAHQREEVKIINIVVISLSP